MAFRSFQFSAYTYPPHYEDLPYLPESNKLRGYFTKENKVTGDRVFLDYELTIPLFCPFHVAIGKQCQMTLDEEKRLTCTVCMEEGRPGI